MTMPTTCLIAVMVRRLKNRMSKDECGTTVAAVVHVCYDTDIGDHHTLFCFLVFPGAFASLGYLTVEVCKWNSNYMHYLHLKMQ